jgi:hypothetical protein
MTLYQPLAVVSANHIGGSGRRLLAEVNENKMNVYGLCIIIDALNLHILVVTICTARFNIQQFYVLPTLCIYVFCVDLRTNSDYFTIQH